MLNRRYYRQFCRYISASWASPTRSVAHLNGISVENTNQSNLNRFLMNINTLDMFHKSVELINRHCTDPVLVLDDTVLQGVESTSRAWGGFMIIQRSIALG